MRLVLMLAVMASLYNIFLDIKLVQFGLLIKIAGHAYVRADKHTVYKRPHQLLLREHVVKFKAWQDVIHCQATVWSDSGCWALANCLTNKPLKEMGLRWVWLHSWSLWTRKKKTCLYFFKPIKMVLGGTKPRIQRFSAYCRDAIWEQV